MACEKPLRILHLVSYPLFSGPMPGTLALARAQADLGHTVWLAYDQIRGNFDGYEESAMPHVRHSGLHLPPGRPLRLSTHSGPRQLFDDWRALRDILRHGQCDVVHTHMSHDHALVALAGTGRATHVRTVHAGRSLRRRFGQAALLRRADGLIVRCGMHQRALVDSFRVSERQVACVPGGIDAATWQLAPQKHAAARSGVRQTFGIPADAPVLGHVALMAGRGHSELLAALAPGGAAALDDVHVLWVGDGPDAAGLKNAVQKMHLQHRVHFTGYLHTAELRHAYAAMDACLVMQVGNDAAARAALEALSAGRPVLAPPDGALGEVVDADVGYPLAVRTPAALAAALAAWLADVGEGHRRGRRGAERMQLQRHFAGEAQTTLNCYATWASGARAP